jgi:hypothetical protein
MKESGVSIESKKKLVLGHAIENEHDSTIGGLVLHENLTIISTFLFKTDATLRYATLQLLAALLRQGNLY